MSRYERYIVQYCLYLLSGLLRSLVGNLERIKSFGAIAIQLRYAEYETLVHSMARKHLCQNVPCGDENLGGWLLIFCHCKSRRRHFDKVKRDSGNCSRHRFWRAYTAETRSCHSLSWWGLHPLPTGHTKDHQIETNRLVNFIFHAAHTD